MGWGHLGRKEDKKNSTGSIAWPGRRYLDKRNIHQKKFFFKFGCFFFFLFVFNLTVPSLSCGIWELAP